MRLGSILTALAVTALFSFDAMAATKNEIQAESALRLPLSQRLKEIEKQGTAGIAELSKMAFDPLESLHNRWRALTSIGRVEGVKAKSILEKALKSSEWFMRNAALTVVVYGDRAWAVKWCRVLMHDPALVVRTAAVQSIKQLNAVEAQDLLWEKLYSSENYRGGKSLWIRRHILEALAQFAKPGQEKNFLAVLKDKDKALHPIAEKTLKKIASL